jgi:nucleoside-diphosphate-sugar epimerase
MLRFERRRTGEIMQKMALILGASGKIGRHSRQAFEAAGWAVRCFDRARDDMAVAARGASVIVNGLNPPKYHAWATLIPAITRDVIAAAKASGATVIIPGNVYNLDDRGGEWSESTPHHPPTQKGRIREEMERAYEASGVRAIVLRAGAFIEPDGKDDTMALLFLREIRKGRVFIAGDPNAMQAYCYLPDWAAAAVALADKRLELSTFEDIPFAGHAFTAEQLRQALSTELGRPLAFSHLPWWVMTALSPFWELARETREMRYLWSLSHTLSGAKLARLLPELRPTPFVEMVRRCLPADLRRSTAGLSPAPSASTDASSKARATAARPAQPQSSR